MNPDGYEYSRSMDRLWFKTRSGPRQGCYGVNSDRNYPFMWGYSGTSMDPCRGPSPLSEAESRNHASFIAANNSTFYAYMSLHSYGENWNYPYDYETSTYPSDVADLKALGVQAADAIRAVYGTRYRVGNTADDIGASDDYAKSVGVKYAYTAELRPGNQDSDNDNSYGFELPESLIVPTAEEFFQGLLVVANKVAADN